MTSPSNANTDYAALIERLESKKVSTWDDGAVGDPLTNEAASALRAVLAENARLMEENAVLSKILRSKEP